MNHSYRMIRQCETPAVSSFTKVSGILASLAVCVIVCTMTWPAVSQEQPLGMLRFMASGPIQIEIHDPEGNIVSRDVIEIAGASFQDENDEILIEIPHRILGDYLVHMNVDGSAIRLRHFDISVTDGINTTLLADYQLIVNAPHDPFVIRSSSDGYADVTAAVAEELSAAEASSSHLAWIVGGFAGLLIVSLLVLRSRKQRKR